MSQSTEEFQRLINERIDQFVADITQLAHQHAMRTLMEALQQSPIGSTPAPGTRRKRTQDDIEHAKRRLLEAICAQPGKRMLTLAPSLQTTPKLLALPARQLLAEKLIRTEGQKRSTVYFPTARGKKRIG